MDIQPSASCEYCDVKDWTVCIVDTSKRVDLFLNKVCQNWRGASVCKNCGMTNYWLINPDIPYEETNDDDCDHEKRKRKK